MAARAAISHDIHAARLSEQGKRMGDFSTDDETLRVPTRLPRSTRGDPLAQVPRKVGDHEAMPTVTSIVEQRKVAIQRIGQHEAGHWMVARVLGFDVGPLKLQLTGRGNELPVPHEASATIYLQRNLPAVGDITTYLRERVQVLYAGALGQALTDGTFDESIAKAAQAGNAKADVDKAAEHLELLLNIERGSDQSLLRPAMRLGARNALCDKLYQLAASRVAAHAVEIAQIGLELANRAFEAPNRKAILTANEIDTLLAGRAQAEIAK